MEFFCNCRGMDERNGCKHEGRCIDCGIDIDLLDDVLRRLENA